MKKISPNDHSFSNLTTRNPKEITETLAKEKEMIIMISSQKTCERKISGLQTNMGKGIEIRDMTMSSLGIACNLIITAAISKMNSSIIRIPKINKVGNSSKGYKRVIRLRLLMTGYSMMIEMIQRIQSLLTNNNKIITRTYL